MTIRHKIVREIEVGGITIPFYDFVTFDNCPRCNGAVYLTHNPVDLLVFVCDSCEKDYPIAEETRPKKVRTL